MIEIGQILTVAGASTHHLNNKYGRPAFIQYVTIKQVTIEWKANGGERMVDIQFDTKRYN